MTITKPHYVVLGGTGSIGYAFTQELLKQHEQVTLLVRNRQKAEKLFPQTPNLHIIEGNVKNQELLKHLSATATHIFHGINYPYDKWINNMPEVTENIIEAAAQNKATILFPGNIYNYGFIDIITEDSPETPGTRKGAIRVKLEQMLREATERGVCRVVLLRLPDFWGPNVLNDGVAPIFRAALKGEAMPWLYRNDIPHQLVYTPDAASIFYKLAQLQSEEPFSLYNYGGEVVRSIKEWQAQIAQLAGTKPAFKLHSKMLFKVLGLFMPVMKEIDEMSYLWENTILLDDTKLHQKFPDLPHTPMTQAIENTLNWFKEHDLQKKFIAA